MKVILTGATGFAGGQALKACIADSSVSEVVALTRRELAPEISSNAKVTVIIHKDFSEYSDELLGELSGAEVCIW